MCGVSEKHVSFTGMLFSKRQDFARLLCVKALDYATGKRFFTREKIELAANIMRDAHSLMRCAAGSGDGLDEIADVARENVRLLGSKRLRAELWGFGWWILIHRPSHRHYGRIDGRTGWLTRELNEYAILYPSKRMAQEKIDELNEDGVDAHQLGFYEPRKTNGIRCY